MRFRLPRGIIKGHPRSPRILNMIRPSIKRPRLSPDQYGLNVSVFLFHFQFQAISVFKAGRLQKLRLKRLVEQEHHPANTKHADDRTRANAGNARRQDNQVLPMRRTGICSFS